MAITVVSWADQLINDGTIYRARLVYAANPFARTGQQVQVQPPGAWPRHIRTNHQPRTVQVFVELVTVSQSNQRTLQQWFSMGTQGELIVNDDGTLKALDAVALGSTPYAGAPNVFVATLVAADPRWRGGNMISTAKALTASGQGWTVNNPGNAYVDDPVMSLRPVANKAAASGYLYAIDSIIAWRAERPSGTYAVEITENWDHATEVAAGRSQTDGDDVRVLVNGSEVPRWFSEHVDHDANDDQTHIWINLTFSPRKTATLLAAITIVEPGPDDELVVSKGGTLGWPRQGALLVDDEVILYTGRTESNADGNAAFTG